jgi:hypothetical protein
MPTDFGETDFWAGLQAIIVKNNPNKIKRIMYIFFISIILIHFIKRIQKVLNADKSLKSITAIGIYQNPLQEYDYGVKPDYGRKLT